MSTSTHAKYNCNSRINECMLTPSYLHKKNKNKKIHNSALHIIQQGGQVCEEQESTYLIYIFK